MLVKVFDKACPIHMVRRWAWVIKLLWYHSLITFLFHHGVHISDDCCQILKYDVTRVCVVFMWGDMSPYCELSVSLGRPACMLPPYLHYGMTPLPHVYSDRVICIQDCLGADIMPRIETVANVYSSPSWIVEQTTLVVDPSVHYLSENESGCWFSSISYHCSIVGPLLMIFYLTLTTNYSFV